MAYKWKNIRQRILPRTLYGRSLMIIVVPILLMQIIVAYVFIDRHWNSISEKLAFALAGEMDMVTDEIKRAKSQLEIDKIKRQAAESLALTVTVQEQKSATRLLKRREDIAWYGIEDKLQQALRRTLVEPFIINVYPDEKSFAVDIQVNESRTIRFVSHDRRLISPTTYIFILWLMGSSIVLMAIAIMFMRNQIRPIHRLAIAAEKLGKGQDVADFKLEGAREVRQAAKAFLDMRDRIRRQIEQRTAMLAGVSHDLRTPLTRMKLQLAMAKKLPEADNLRQDLEEMEKMLEAYLTFARGEGNEATEQVDLKTVLERIVNNARRQGYSIEVQYAGDLMIRARPVAIERALVNVINNACKFAKNVWVNARTSSEVIEVFVDDDGSGIPPAQREEVFKPFYRLEKSRNPKTGGIGLGLSIVQDIIHGHGGEIFLEQSNRGGLRAVIRLPL